MSRLNPPVNSKDHIQGLPDAIIEFVEYGDYQCPYCGKVYPVIKEIQETFGEKLMFVFRHFPLSNIHKYALPAAIATEAANRQHKFWQMHDAIYERQPELSESALKKFAVQIGLEMAAFERDMSDESITEKIELDFESGMHSGVNGTPSFFINGYRYEGYYDYTSLSNAIKANLQPTF